MFICCKTGEIKKRGVREEKREGERREEDCKGKEGMRIGNRKSSFSFL